MIKSIRPFKVNKFLLALQTVCQGQKIKFDLRLVDVRSVYHGIQILKKQMIQNVNPNLRYLKRLNISYILKISVSLIIIAFTS